MPQVMKANIPRPASSRSFLQKRFRPCAGRFSFFPGKTHTPVRGRPSRTVRAAEDSQTVRGPVLLSLRKRLPSR